MIIKKDITKPETKQPDVKNAASQIVNQQKPNKPTSISSPILNNVTTPWPSLKKQGQGQSNTLKAGVGVSGAGMQAGIGQTFIQSNIGKTTDSTGVSTTNKRGSTEQKKEEEVISYNGYQICTEPIMPKWDETIYDSDYKYDPNLKATKDDYKNWAKWGVINAGASIPAFIRKPLAGLFPDDYKVFDVEVKDKLNKDLSDATDTYTHYRENTGLPYYLDFQKAYNEDEAIRLNTIDEIRETQLAVEQLRAQSGLNEFNVSGGLHGSAYYPQTENWQKAVGGYNSWSYGEVKYENGEYTMSVSVNTLDRYNFDKDKQDVGTGTPDEVNGRFEALGWASSFDTYGSMPFNVTWKEGEIVESEPVLQEGRK